MNHWVKFVLWMLLFQFIIVQGALFLLPAYFLPAVVIFGIEYVALLITAQMENRYGTV